MDRARPASPKRRRSVALLLSLILGLGAAGCGAGTSSRTSPSTVSPTTSTHTTGSSRTTTTSATSAALPGTGRPAVTIGDKNYTEQFVLGQLWLQALRHQGFTVNITQNIGPPGVVRQALAGGSLAMYPEYIDLFDQSIAGERAHPHTLHAALASGRRWASRHGLQLLDPTPFSDTTGIAVTDVFAATHGLRSLAGLTRLAAPLTMGGAVEFRTQHAGLPALADVYGVAPTTFRSLAVGSQYDELNTGAIQAAFVNTTDGQLASGDYRVLGDPRRVFGFGNVVPVVSDRALTEEGPAFAATVERVDRTLSLATIRELNAEASVSTTTPAAVATAYLQTHGLLPPLPDSGG